MGGAAGARPSKPSMSISSSKATLTNPKVLLLHRRSKELPMVFRNDDMLSQLDADFERFVDRIAEGVKKNENSLSDKIYEMDESVECELIGSETIVAVVGKFEACTLEQTLLLIQYSIHLPRLKKQLCFINSLLRNLEARNLLDSELSLHVWVHAKYIKEEDPDWKDVRRDALKLCTDALDKLEGYKSNFFRHYQKCIEDDVDWQP
jgi:hypothetical protein